MNIVDALVTGGISLLMALGAWFVTTVQSKERIAFMQGAMATLKADHEKELSSAHRKIGELEKSEAATKQELKGIHEQILSKASKESVDGFKSEIHLLRQHMDKGFDKIGDELKELGNQLREKA